MVNRGNHPIDGPIKSGSGCEIICSNPKIEPETWKNTSWHRGLLQGLEQHMLYSTRTIQDVFLRVVMERYRTPEHVLIG